ncbi:pseudaminic acid synthase [Achromobacter xylosoxidans]|uniref:pseudaminic acid synthase n=1 Tax=Alcaligenes xylosoxydans xylosoxydans TaxID=85698 RepID=UPI0003321228|nr:pseudaminic acid synthase [Achromobacter xylosoxidans]KOQ31142.1 N-acetylneuraminate synthase [Achromobacter xylosoxidans]KOQ31492.1 N-acetylneuraminate synthase [Achromobacter xylosoxidans]KOQ34518.1 N-acetylneuraminate synthase [Achromobacter xylosoxidans]KOQ44962.1 N-acetylneuraminate synthase [Achromobacter xylosoxidans]KOQ47135.1 N-acetylneuraminate synthase [Achromobacter xylosoxidans]
MSITFSLGDRLVGSDQPPFIIAEMSGNHNQSLDRALELVDAAAQAGAHAVKLQTYTADTITLNVREGEFTISDEKSLWKGNNLHDLYSKAYTPWEWHAPIMERAKAHGMMCFSSPFDESAVDFLLQLDVPAFKIASFENNHLPLIRKVAATGKPMIISTGMASLADLEEAVATARAAGCKDLVLLKCTSTYPASASNTNVSTIPHMRTLFGCQVGLSDHTMGVGVSVAAVALGATVVEKHFTLRRADGGVDSAFSLEPEELKSLVVETRRAWEALGKVTYGPTEAERKSLVFRRSLYIAKDMRAGEVLTSENLRVVRPGMGLHPRYYEDLLGRKVRQDLKMGTAVSWDLIA